MMKSLSAVSAARACKRSNNPTDRKHLSRESKHMYASTAQNDIRAALPAAVVVFERVSMCADVLAPTSLSSAPTTWRHDLAQGHSSFSLTSTPAASAATSVEYRITANLNDSRDYRFAGVNGTKRNRIFGTSERDKRHW